MGHTNTCLGGGDGVPPPNRPKKVQSKKFLMDERKGERSEFGLERRSEQRVYVLELDAKGFLPLGFVPQQVHLAHFRDAAVSMSQTVSSPSWRWLRTLCDASTE